MLESNSYTQSWYCFKFNVPNSINVLMKRGVEDCIFLFLPEDTTEKADHRHSDCINIGVNMIRSTVKVVFLIAISVAASLAVGQLQ